MNNVLTIIKKEFARFFKDKRLVLSTLILPGLLIFLLYTLMGSVFTDSTQTYTAKVVNPSAVFGQIVDGEESGALFELTEIPAEELDAAKEEVKAGDADLVIVFPENFDAVLTGGQTYPVGQAPVVEVWYNSGSTASSSAYSLVVSLLDSLENSMSNLFDVNYAAGGDLVTAQEAEASYYAMLLPFLILTFLYSGCMGIAPESIAGEKERGTIATLLRRSELVIGKIASLSVLSALSAISSFLGTFLALPKLTGGSIGGALASYSAGQYFALFAVMLSAVLIIVSLISIISAFAKSVKEAASLSVPLMLVVMLVGLSTMLFTTHAPAAFLIPIYNCVQVMAEIFSLQFSWVNLVITLASNLVYIVVLVWLLTKMFKSERIVFNK